MKKLSAKQMKIRQELGLTITERHLRHPKQQVIFHPGDIVEAKWGERRLIWGYTRSAHTSFDKEGWYQAPIYRTIDTRSVRDQWPAEVIARKAGHVALSAAALRSIELGHGAPSEIVAALREHGG